MFAEDEGEDEEPMMDEKAMKAAITVSGLVKLGSPGFLPHSPSA